MVRKIINENFPFLVKENIYKIFIYLLVTFIAMPIAYFTLGRDKVFIAVRLLFCILSLLYVFICFIKDKKIDKFSVILLVLFGFESIRNFQTCESIEELLTNLQYRNDFAFFCFGLLINQIIKKDHKTYIGCLSIYFELIIELNCLYVLSGRTNALGLLVTNRNLYFNVFAIGLLACCFNYYLYKTKLNRIRYVILYISCIFLAFISDSSTSKIGLMIIGILPLLSNIKNSEKILNIYGYYLAYIVTFVSIVILRLQNLFSFFIVDILHKSLSLSTRTYVWDFFINKISESIYIGHGALHPWLDMYIEETNVMANMDAHNEILWIMFCGGVVWLIIYGLLYFLPSKNIYKNKDNEIVKYLCAVLFAYLICSIAAHTCYYSYSYVLLVLMYNISSMLKNEN